MRKKYLGITLALLAALTAIGLVIYRWQTAGFKWNDFADSLRQVDWNWLSAGQFLILLTYLGRALRWEVMLRPLCRRTNLWRIFSATAIGFTAVVLFGRAGEPVRPYLIAKKEGLTFSSQIAAWVVERILDLLMVLVIFGIALTQVSRSAIQPSPMFRVILQAGGLTAGIAGKSRTRSIALPSADVSRSLQRRPPAVFRHDAQPSAPSTKINRSPMADHAHIARSFHIAVFRRSRPGSVSFVGSIAEKRNLSNHHRL